MITLTPAYGRDYKSKTAVLEDWNAGKDFVIQQIGHPYDGRYANKENMKDEGKVQLRYAKLTKVVIAEV